MEVILPTIEDFNEIPAVTLTTEQLEDLQHNGWRVRWSERRLNYRSDWDLWMGFREFVQNALDETQGVECNYDIDSGTSYVVDYGGGFKPIHLLLGEVKTFSWEDKYCARGHFGEGMKIAVHPFLRKDKRIFIRTAGFDFTFASALYENSDVPVVISLQRPNNFTKGTVVALEAFDCRPYLERFTLSLPPKEILLSIQSNRHNCQTPQVLNKIGYIYVRDIFVQKSYYPYLFGYNFWFGEKVTDVLGPNRNKFLAEGRELTREWSQFLHHQSFIKEMIKRFKDYKEVGRSEDGRPFEYKLLADAMEELRGPTYEDELEHDAIKITAWIDEAIREVFPIKEDYSWSSNFDEAKILKHLDVFDLEPYLPDISEILSMANFCKPVDSWHKLRDLEKVNEITTTQLEEAITRAGNERMKYIYSYDEEGNYLPDISEEEDAIRVKKLGVKWLAEDRKIIAAYEELHNLLDNYSRDMTGYSFHFFLKPNEMDSKEIDKVGGFCSYDTQSVWVKFSKFTYTNITDGILETLNHELAHALCFGKFNNTENSVSKEKRYSEWCSDLTDMFERYLVKVGLLMVKKWPHLYSEVDRLVKIFDQPLKSHDDGWNISQILNNEEEDTLSERNQEDDTPSEEYFKLIEMISGLDTNWMQGCVKYPQLVDKKDSYRYNDCWKPHKEISYQELIDTQAEKIAEEYAPAVATYFGYLGDIEISPDEIDRDELAEAFINLRDFKQQIDGNLLVWKIGRAIIGDSWYHSHYFYSAKGSWDTELAKKRATRAITAWASQ